MADTVATTFLQRAIKFGLIAGAVVVYLGVVGLIHRFEGRDVITDLIGLGRLFLLVTAGLFGYMAARPPKNVAGEEIAVGPATTVLSGVISGAIAGVFGAALALLQDVVDLHSVLNAVSDALVDAFFFGQSTGAGIALLIAAGAITGGVGAATHVLPHAIRRAAFAGLGAVLLIALFSQLFETILSELGLPTDVIFEGDGVSIGGALIIFAAVGVVVWAWTTRGHLARERFDGLPQQQQNIGKWIAFVLLLALLVRLPQIVGPFNSEVIGTIGLYVLIGLGLNIVVGFAGLLDLGYVAFFAVGAYSMAVLTSPQAASYSIEMNFWIALPLVVLMATVAGILIGAPVLRLRGDYLAIVTLGFGEITRVLVISNWFIPVTGGAQGIRRIPDPIFVGTELDDPQTIYYLILVACVVAAFISLRLQTSRVGRAWNAMREDESVAEAMGISIIKYKLLAFATGAAIGSLGGVFFAVKIGSVFPASFGLFVSILALAVIVLGGMGSVRGVVVGAAVLVGLPELLREFTEYRLLFYGAILVAVMILKPEGLLPSIRRKVELHVEEEPEQPTVAGEPSEARA